MLRFLYECAYNADDPFYLTNDATAFDPKLQSPEMWARHLSYELYARMNKLTITDSDAFMRSVKTQGFVISSANTKLTTTAAEKPHSKQTTPRIPNFLKKLTTSSNTNNNSKKSTGSNSKTTSNHKTAGDDHPRKSSMKKTLRIKDTPRDRSDRMCLHFLMRKYGVKFKAATHPPSCREPCQWAHTPPTGFSVADFLKSTELFRQQFSDQDASTFEKKITSDSSLE